VHIIQIHHHTFKPDAGRINNSRHSRKCLERQISMFFLTAHQQIQVIPKPGLKCIILQIVEMPRESIPMQEIEQNVEQQ
jgi:hypothetical protein